MCYKHQLNIIHNNEFVDNTSGHFFMRTELEGYFNDETFFWRISTKPFHKVLSAS
ncbi:hypothetical protein QW180_15740 [Vibrio sinaloensis]|nr:hypothetical protein [Vibrio sinaloensis]